MRTAEITHGKGEIIKQRRRNLGLISNVSIGINGLLNLCSILCREPECRNK